MNSGFHRLSSRLICSETRASRPILRSHCGHSATNPASCYPMKLYFRALPQCPLPSFSSSSETAQRPHYSHASTSVPLTAFQMIWTASLFCQLRRKVCLPYVTVVKLFSQFILFQKEPKGSSSIIIKHNVSSLLGAWLVQSENTRNDGFSVF